MATVEMGLVNALDLMDRGLVLGNVAAVRKLLADLRPQAVEIEINYAADFARLNWLEAHNIALSKNEHEARIYVTPPSRRQESSVMNGATVCRARGWAPGRCFRTHDYVYIITGIGTSLVLGKCQAQRVGNDWVPMPGPVEQVLDIDWKNVAAVEGTE